MLVFTSNFALTGGVDLRQSGSFCGIGGIEGSEFSIPHGQFPAALSEPEYSGILAALAYQPQYLAAVRWETSLGCAAELQPLARPEPPSV